MLAKHWLSQGAERCQPDSPITPHAAAELRQRSGKKIEARIPGDSNYKSLAPAPGTYVKLKAAQQIQ